MAVNPKNEEEFKNLTHGYSPSNYSVLKIRGHEHWLKRLVWFLIATAVIIILVILYLQSICLDTWYTRIFYKWFRIANVCTDVSNKINIDNKLSFNDGILTLSNGTSTTAVSIPYLIPGAPDGIIGKNGLPGQGGQLGQAGATGTPGTPGAAGPAGPAGSGGLSAVVNDANVTGSLAASVLTLGWSGQLAPTRGGTGIDGSTAANGTLLIGNGTGYTLANIGGTANQVIVTNGAGSISLSLPQDIATTSNVTFADITSNGDLNASGNTTIGDASTDRVTFNAEITGGTPLVFQGSADDGNTTTFAITNPTAVRSITVPDASGTFAVSATGPISLNSSGDISCSTCLTTVGNGDILSGTGIALTGTTAGRLVGAGNVTFALNTTGVTAGSYGSATAVPTFIVDANGRLTAAADVAIAIDASQITSGTLPIIRGGTNSTTVGSAGSVAFSNGTSYNFTAAGTSGQFLTSAGVGTPTWTTLSGVAVTSATGTANQVLVNGTTGIAQSGAITLTTPQDIGTGSNVTFNNITADGVLTANGNTTIGDASSDTLTITSTITGATPLVFEGATPNAFETSFTITDPTADRSINIPNASGTLAISATGPIALSALGDISCSTCLVSAGSLFTAAATSGVNSSISQGGTLTIAAGNGVTTTGNGTGTVTVARNSGAASGDVQYWDGSNWINLSIGTAGEVLTVTAGLPTWEPTGAAGDPIVGNEVLNATIAGGLVRAGSGTLVDPWTLGVDVVTAGTTATTANNSGLEVATDGLSLLRGCTDAQVLVWSAGASEWQCAAQGGGGGGITTINSQSGPVITISNASGAANVITIDDATTAAKGIASFNSTNFTVSAGAVNLSDTGVTAASYAGSDNGDGSLDIPNFTVDAKGRLSAAGTSIVTLTGIPNSSLANSAITVTTGTSGTDFNVSGSPVSLGGVVTLNIPDASTTNRGLVTTGIQTFGGDKTFNDALTVEGITTLNGNTIVGSDATDTVTFNATVTGATPLVFEGATSNVFETSLAVVDPTADNTITFPNASGTVAVSASGPITLSAAGNIACPTCVTSGSAGDIVNGTGMSSTGTLTGRLIGVGNVTFSISDTGVTAASYGSASSVATFTVDAQGRLTAAANTAIAISASQITSGTLPIVRGGTNQTTIGSAGSIAYSDGTSYQFNAAGTAGQILTSGGAGSPTWSSLSGLVVTSATGTANQVLVNGTSGAATTGAITLTTPQDIATTSSPTFDSLTLGSDLAVNGGDITSSATTFNLLNATVTTLNIGGAATTANYGPGGATATTLNFAGGSGATGCTIDGATGNLSCSGAIATTATSGTQGWWSRSGITLSPTTAGDNVTTSGNISTTGIGTISSAGLLTSTGGITTSGGAFSLTGNAASSLSTTAGNAISITSGTTGAVSFDSGTTGAVNLGTGASAKTVTLGNNTGATAVNINSGTGNINLQPGGTGTTANVQIGAGGAGSTTPDLMVLDRKSDAGDPTGTNGAMYYNASSNKFRCFENSVWIDCITASFSTNAKSLTKTSTETIVSDSTLSDDSQLMFSIGAGETWSYRYVLQVNSPTPADMKFAITAPAGATCQVTATSYKNNNSISQLGCGVSSGLMSTSASDEMIEVTGSVENGGTAGTVHVQWAQNTSNVGTTSVFIGSFVNAFKETGADLAEIYYTHDNAQMGEVVSLDSSMKAGVKKSSGPYDPSVLGIISTKPGYVLADSTGTDPSARPVNLALSGRVPVKVSDENGPVKAGDPLTTSSTPGVAMKATQPGWVIGMAMEDHRTELASVLTFVNRAWYSGEGNKKIPSLTGLTLTDGTLAGVETAQTTAVQAGLESNDPELVSQALDILRGIQTTVVGQQTQLEDLKGRLSSLETGGSTSIDILKTLADAKAVELGGDLTVNGDVVIAGKLSVGKDTAGEKIVAKGTKKSSVRFTKPYKSKPVVNITPEDFVDGQYRVVSTTVDGFEIELSQPQSQDIKFNWTALQN